MAVLLGRQIQSLKKVNVRLADDNYDPRISCCVFLSNGYLVAFDYYNNNIKLLDTSWSLQGSLKFPSKLYDVSVIDDNTVIVTIPSQEQLQYVQVFPQLKPGHVIQLNMPCWGVEVSKEEIYVSCHNHPGDCEVRVLDKQGNPKRRLGISKDGSYLFSVPDYITVSTAGDRLFVSDCDWRRQTVTCIKVDGSVVYQYRDADLKEPMGLCCDDEDSIMVCGFLSDNIHMIATDGEKYGTLLSSQDGLKWPESVAYRKSDNTLVVGCERSNNMLVYQLSK